MLTIFDSTNHLIITVKIMKFIYLMALLITLFSVQVAGACDKEGPWSEVWIEVWVPPEVIIVEGFHFEIGDGYWEWQLSGYRDPCGYFHFADQMMHDPGGQ